MGNVNTCLDLDWVAELLEVVWEDDKPRVGADQEEGADAQGVPPDGPETHTHTNQIKNVGKSSGVKKCYALLDWTWSF